MLPSEKTAERIRAAEYVRMSTEHQQYSTENQRQAIQQYAERRAWSSCELMPTRERAGSGLTRGFRRADNGTIEQGAICRGFVTAPGPKGETRLRWARTPQAYDRGLSRPLPRSQPLTIGQDLLFGLKKSSSGTRTKPLGILKCKLR